MSGAADVKTLIAKCLGTLWILDGLLQFQPNMFGVNFINQILVPNLSAQPAFMQAIVQWGINTWNFNPPLCDLAAALLQIGIGALLLFPLASKMCKTGLWISIVWGVLVWLCGEGAGALLTGGASFYTGAPGAVVFYIILAVFLLWPEKISLRWYPIAAAISLLFGALLQLQGAFWTTDGLQSTVMGSTMMEPYHVLNALPTHFSNMIGTNPVTWNIILVALLFVIGGLLLWRPNKKTAIVALVFLFLVWWFGQDFGGLSTVITGTPTDPNSAPLLALFLLPLFFARNATLEE